MRKRITFLLVLTAAVLLSLPAQAQVARKATKGQTKKFRTERIDNRALQRGKAAKLKAEEAAVQGIAFRGQATVAQPAATSLEADQALKAADQTAGKLFKAWNWKANQAPKYVSKSGLVNTDNVPQPLFKFKGREVERFARFDGQSKKILRAETADDHGIITAPDEGVTKYYTRTGTAFYYASGSVYNAEQSGVVTIVECEDAGTVYIKDPISRYSQNSWVKGTKDGNTITVAAGQPLAWNATYSATLGLYWGNVQSTGTGNTYIKGEGDITFTVDDEAGTITLDGSSQDKIIAVFWDDDNSWSGYGDYNSVWTLNTEYEPASTDPIVLPDGAEVQNWYADGTGSAAVPTDVMVAFVGNEVYISGLTSNFPDAWIKGTLDGTTVTFSKFQYVGTYGGTMPIWAVGADSDTGNLQDFTMTYDSEAQTLALDANQFIVFNAAEDRMYYLSYIESLTIYAEEPAPAVIETLPYVNSFDDAADQKHFTIIDANEDGRTWNWYIGMARYTYSSTNPGDDWLVSPAIKLVAGKKYAFSIAAHAQSASYPERIEVKAAQENTAEALAAGTEVLPSTDVTTPGFVTYENNEFTVAESGYYYIGVHAISDADKYYLYVDDFVLDAAPLTPDYTADFSTDAQFGDFSVLDANEDGRTWNWSATNGAYYNYSSTNAADDYLILPIKLEAGKNYDVTVTARAAGASYPETFEVVAGKEATVAGLSTTVIAETTVATTTNTDYTGTLSPEETGTYYVAIHATSEADMYQLRVSKFSIELGAAGTAPAAVTDFTATAVENELAVDVAFTAPTKTIAGEELSALTKIEVLRDGAVVKTFDAPSVGGALSFKDEGLEAGTHKYQVIPYNEDGIGEKSEELSVLVVAALNVPYTFDLTQSLLDLFQVIDNNADSKTWAWSSSYGTYYSYSSTSQADDYLITAPFNLKAGKNYLVTVAATAYSASYPERFEVLVGKTATVAGLTQTVIDATEVTSNVSTEFEGEFSVAEDGQYFIAVHAISDADMWRLNLQKLSIELGAEPTAPAAVADLVAEAGAEGALEVNLSFTAPAKAVDGTDLTGTEDIKIYRDGALVNTLTDVAVGSEQTWKDTGVENGKTYTYYVVAANASGDGQKSEKVSVFVGADELGPVQNFAAVGTTATTINFAWDAVQGINGGYVDAANVTYSIYTLAIETDPNWGFQYLVADQKLAEVTGDTEATVNFPVDEGELQYKYFGVSVKNATTEESDPAEAYTYVVIGAPEELPILEGFADSKLHYNTWNYSDDADLMVSDEATDGDGVALNIISYTADSDQAIWLEKVNLKSAANPTLIFDVKSSDISSVDIIGSKDGAEFSVIATQAISGEYTTVKVSLADVVGTRFSKVGISAHFANETVIDPWYGTIEELGDVLVIDNIKVVDLLEYNLGIEVTAPKTVNTGESAVIKAVVTNKGENAASDYKVTIKAGDEVLLEQTESEELGSFETKEISAELATSIFDEAGDVTITATVDFLEDLDLDDNAAEAVITIKASDAAAPTDVAAEEDAENPGSITVTWNAPENATQEVTEDFASYENGADETGELGEWTLINANGHTKGGIFQDTSLASDGLVRAWQVFNLATYGGDNSAFAGPDGDVDNNYLISTYNLENQAYPGNDDWLISPSLPGVAQTVSFDVKAFNDYGPQTYQVLYSTTGKETTDFTLIEEVADNGNAWSKVSYELPAGTTYFAIRNITGGDEGFILAVDNIQFSVGGGEVVGYNIYLDEELVASVDAEGNEVSVEEPAAPKLAQALSYVINNVPAGEHTVAVTALYAGGKESAPTAAGANTTITGIAEALFGGQAFDVYTIDGKLLRKQAASLSGLKAGAYIINGKKVVIK
ncbi:MAG: choice-of-anchor J domain-containing protein [Prevotella sp.]|nr:choice-of-anchor J domain-containing protein [Prevotella sp.]